MKSIRIPAEEVVPVIEEHLALMDYDNPLQVFAERARIEFDTLYKIVELKRTKKVELGLVDQLFTAMGDPIGLWERQPFREYYDMLLPRCARRSCNNILPFDPMKAASQNKRRYCSVTCRDLACRHRTGRANDRELMCRNGHIRTEENTRITPDGYRTCRVCERNKNREARRKRGSRSLARTCRNGHPRMYTVTTYPPSRPNGHRRCLVCEGKMQVGDPLPEAVAA